MTAYHTRFTRIKPFVQERTKFVIRHWNNPEYRDQWAILEAWMFIVCLDERGYHGMRKPTLVRDENAGSGYYLVDSNEIHMSKPSIITLLHEFRHAMQAQGFAGRFRDPEEDARGWSLSLYYSAAPRSLERLVRENRVFFMEPADFAPDASGT